MDHPHNAVLLLCSSREKGCRSYICDTSYRHSNCLDRFKKLRTDIPSVVANSDGGLGRGQGSPQAPIPEPLSANQSMISNSSESNFLNCPLCRGSVLGWMIVKEARQYLDMKPRSCSRESCSFSGTYGELRRHARRVHPATRPGDVDPLRQRAWHRLEQRREYGDIVSAIRSAMPGAIVLGDYVIDNGDGLEGPPGPGEGPGGPWWTTYFLFQMISSPAGSLDESRSSSRTWRRHRRPSDGHRNLWGENLRGLRDDDGDGDEDAPLPRRRRRFVRSRHEDEERP